MAARFGRLDVAAEGTMKSARGHFLDRRRTWGREIRLLDVELANLVMKSPHEAVIHVEFSWKRVSEGQVRKTIVRQVWRDDEGGFRMAREKFAGGDVGLFGESVEVVRPPKKDVHFKSYTLGQ